MQRDFVRDMMDAWTNEGMQAAYDLAPSLLEDIDTAFTSLRTQAVVIRSLTRHLLDTGEVAEHVEPEPGLDAIEASERPRLIVGAAIDIWNRKPAEDITVTGDEVLDELTRKGLDLGVKQPIAVIGTVLASGDGFKKIARNTFEYSTTGNTIDLPW